MKPTADSKAPPSRRFLVSMSFPRVKRDFVRKVAEVLGRKRGKERVFYDDWYKAELAQPDLDDLLGDIYEDESELVVPFFCQGYKESRWCGLEWRRMRAMLFAGEGRRIMPFRFDSVNISGSLPIDGFIEIVDDTEVNRMNPECTITPEQVAELILRRLGTVQRLTVSDPLHSLPSVPPNFTGRLKELAALREPFTVRGVVLTGLRGMGGIGKTALGVVLAHQWKERFPDGQIFLDGLGLTENPPAAEALMEKVIHAFHPEARLEEETDALKSVYKGVLSGKRVLIFLDNAKDATQAGPLTPPEGCGFIVTSRQGFLLDGSQPLYLDSLTECDAAALLRKYITLTDEEVRELVARCCRLPLALKLAGSYLAMDASDRRSAPNVRQYIEKLNENRLPPIDEGAEDCSEELPTITHTLRLSEGCLSPDQRETWRALSVFPAPFDERAALAVSKTKTSILRLLVRRSLLEWEHGRLKLHDLAAEYARRELGEEMLEEWQGAYVDHYIAVAREAQEAYLTGGENLLVGLRLFDGERAHFEAAFNWLKSRNDMLSAQRLVDLVRAISHPSDLRFHPRQRIRWLGAQLHCALKTENRHAEGAALNNLGNAHIELGGARRAIEYYEQSLAAFRETSNRSAEGQILNNLGVAYHLLEDGRKALDNFEQALTITRETGNRRGEGVTLGNLGVTHADLYNAREAIEYYEHARALARETGNRRGEGKALNNLGLAHADLGNVPKALDYYRQRLHIARETGDRRGEGIALWNSAAEIWEQGDREEAIFRAKEALQVYEAIEDPIATGVRRVLQEWEAAER